MHAGSWAGAGKDTHEQVRPGLGPPRWELGSREKVGSVLLY